MDCRTDDWVCEALDRVGLRGFTARTVEVLLAHPLKILLIVVLGFIASRLGSRIVRGSLLRIGSRAGSATSSVRLERRAATLSGVVASLVRLVVWSIATLLILGELGLNLGPFLAGASVVGVALGFGAQSLVKDYLSGFFILAEDQYGVGDRVNVAEVTGLVQEVNLRITKLQADDGTVWFVPNGEIRKAGNLARRYEAGAGEGGHKSSSTPSDPET